MTIQEFKDKYLGQVLTVTGPDGGECTAVAHAWCVANGRPIVYGDAKDTFSNAALLTDDYDTVVNKPNNFPPPGAIVVIGARPGDPAGHTFLVEDADGDQIHGISQNDPTGSPVIEKTYDYSNVIGWYMLKGLDLAQGDEEEVTTATNPDNGEVRDAQGWLNAYIERNRQWDADEKQIGDLKGELADAQDQLAKARAMVKALNDANDELQKQIQTPTTSGGTAPQQTPAAAGQLAPGASTPVRPVADPLSATPSQPSAPQAPARPASSPQSQPVETPVPDNSKTSDNPINPQNDTAKPDNFLVRFLRWLGVIK